MNKKQKEAYEQIMEQLKKGKYQEPVLYISSEGRKHLDNLLDKIANER